jgi:hypothetical protein
MAPLAAALAGALAISVVPAGTGSPLVVVPCFLAMPVGVCTAIGCLFDKGPIRALVGLLIGFPLSAMFWDVWQGVNC